MAFITTYLNFSSFILQMLLRYQFFSFVLFFLFSSYCEFG